MKLGAIFDMDGLLFDTERIFDEVWYILGEKYGFIIPEDFFDATRGTSGEDMRNVVNYYFPSQDPSILINDLFNESQKILLKGVPMKEGVLEILDYFKNASVKMAIASSSPTNMIINNLKKAGISKYFDAITSGEEVQNGKPSPEIFQLAASKINVSTDKCYAFEDGIHGVFASVIAGCSTIMIPDLICPTKEVKEVCSGVYPSLLDALHAIRNGECK